ncbi:tetratricopeptide repeat protein [Sphingosinicella sp. LHD-64]|uniref:tetratricopeptide repeat protein n=1 Tax=Sphingosinicella sp. LHD-64 TaxID=3072139 RepID=UPI0028107588|nr:tetratricopeptide repeat protein [Sphingosinicella sp. LHD-64]MDQ8756499.1 tetratricopeptide repeat protein [Sphingosinicella sp. LHD-64]
MSAAAALRTPVQATLADAMRLGRAGQADAAARLLHAVLATDPEHYDALQLLGLLARGRGDHAAAADLFRKSLRANPYQPHVLNNLGNALTGLARQDEAIAAYREALRLQPAYQEAEVNLASALLARGEAVEACDVLKAATRRAPQDGKAWALLGRALRAGGRLDEAVAALRTALELRPGHVATKHNLAVALRLAGRPDQALALLRQCAAADPGSPEIRYNLGHCLQDLGDTKGAAQAYRETIALRPTDRDAHASLNRLCWQAGDHAAYLASYRDALRLHPRDSGLLADLAHQLTLSGQAAEAVALLTPAVGRSAVTADIHHRLGQALWSQGRIPEALVQFAAGREREPNHAPLRRETARSLIILERYEEALAVLGEENFDQQALAYQGLCRRFLGDARAAALNDYDRFVGGAILTPPEGDIVTFNAQLASTLAGLHVMAEHPLEQTLRGGTQTIGDLFDRRIPEIRTIRAMIEAEVARYIAALPNDPGHPFLARKSRSFAFSGSWSVRLRQGGHHVNHVHPEGWISSCYYVALPPSVSGGSHQGWLKFGETALHLGAREEVAKLVRPEVGKLVLFPSYFYHGTVPFEDDAFRTTIAFDVVPAP